MRVAAVVLGVLLLTSSGAVPSDEGPGVDDIEPPGRDAVADAITAYSSEGSITGYGTDGTTLSYSGAPEELEQEEQEGEETVVSLSADILFGFGEAELSEAARERIADLVADLPEGLPVSVGGHTDSIGGEGLNQELSERRASAVAAVVQNARADLELTVEGFGESQPVEPNTQGGEDNPQGRAANRRVELRYDD